IAFLRSCSPPSIFLISPACTSWSSDSSACANSASTASPDSDHSTSTPRSSLFFLSDNISSRSCSSRRRRCRTFCASAWSFQKSSAADRASSLLSSSSGLAASKITPEIRGSLGEVLIAAHQVVDGGHGEYCTSSVRLQVEPDVRSAVSVPANRSSAWKNASPASLISVIGARGQDWPSRGGGRRRVLAAHGCEDFRVAGKPKGLHYTWDRTASTSRWTLRPGGSE